MKQATKTTKRLRRKFTVEFKQNVAVEALSGSISAVDLAKREGIPLSSVQRWKKQFKEQVQTPKSSGRVPAKARLTEASPNKGPQDLLRQLSDLQGKYIALLEEHVRMLHTSK